VSHVCECDADFGKESGMWSVIDEACQIDLTGYLVKCFTSGLNTWKFSRERVWYGNRYIDGC
jgi:hypothetical protein